jgi:hypothetical protein
MDAGSRISFFWFLLGKHQVTTPIEGVTRVGIQVGKLWEEMHAGIGIERGKPR